MPFYWMNSVFMILFIIVTLVFLYWYKNMEGLGNLGFKKDDVIKFNLKW